MSARGSSHYLGLEWVGDCLRAGVFDSSWRLVGKVSRSAKANRGPAEVLKRIARCALDAVDEADLQPAAIRASAILTNGVETGQTWGPEQVNQLATLLPAPMSSNLVTAGRVASIMSAVEEHEFPAKGRSWIAFFAEPEPALYAADPSQPGRLRPVVLSVGRNRESRPDGAPDWSAWSDDLLASVSQLQPERLLLVGPHFEDAEADGTRRIAELLLALQLRLPVHTPAHAAHVGVWAATRLAAQTFATESA